jgi:hypothetical protein
MTKTQSRGTAKARHNPGGPQGSTLLYTFQLHWREAAVGAGPLSMFV